MKRREVDGSCTVFYNLTREHMQSWHCLFEPQSLTRGYKDLSLPPLKKISKQDFWTEVTTCVAAWKESGRTSAMQAESAFCSLWTCTKEGEDITAYFQIETMANTIIFLSLDTLPT